MALPGTAAVSLSRRAVRPVRRPWGIWAVATVSLISIALYVVTALERIGYPYELQFFEGSTVEVAARVTEGLPLYGPPTTDFTPWPYPPLYFMVTGELARVIGINLTTLRIVSFAASLVSVVLLILIVRKSTGRVVAGLVAAGLFAGTYRVSGAWFDAARVDSLLVVLLLAAIFAGMSARTWKGGVAVGLLLFLAFLTKQNALVVAVPMLAWLLIRRRPAGVAASALLAVASVGSVVVGDAVTGGWYSTYVVGQLLGQGSVLRWLAEFWLVDLILPFAVVLGAFAVWFRKWGWQTEWGEDSGYLLSCVAGLWLAGLVGRLHDGGYVNVAIPAHVGMAILLGLATATFIAHPATTQRMLGVGAAILALQVAVMSAWHLRVIPTEADRAAGDRFIASLRAIPGRVLVPSHPYYLRLAGRPVAASTIAVDDLLATRGGRAREAMESQLPWSLEGVDALVIDSPEDQALFGPALDREFTRVSSNFVPSDDFRPVTDVPAVPSLLFVRNSGVPR